MASKIIVDQVQKSGGTAFTLPTSDGSNKSAVITDGAWFGWSDSKNKVYENLVIHHSDKEKPSKEWLDTELTRQQDAWDAEQTAKQERLDSAKSKLENLGLTAEEVKEVFNI